MSGQTLSSEDDGPANETPSDEDPLYTVTTTVERRTLPARAKRQSQSYVQISDSDSCGDIGAKDGSEVDSEFSIGKMNEEAKEKRKRALGTAVRDLGGEAGIDGEHDGLCVKVGKDGDDCEESDAQSGTTRRTSWKSALEEI